MAAVASQSLMAWSISKDVAMMTESSSGRVAAEPILLRAMGGGGGSCGDEAGVGGADDGDGRGAGEGAATTAAQERAPGAAGEEACGRGGGAVGVFFFAARAAWRRGQARSLCPDKLQERQRTLSLQAEARWW
jgi:hypothetical protein